MQTWTTTYFSTRVACFAALLLLASAQGCSCEEQRDIEDADVVADAFDTAELDDAADDTDSTDDASDAVEDTASDATDSGQDARDADDVEDADDGGSTGDTTDTTAGDATDADPQDTGPADADSGADDAVTDTSDTADATGDADDVAPDSTTPAGDCISGATGTHAVRFGWRGNGPNSTAYVDYEVNELPDTSRWKAGAYAQSFSYTPVYTDTFLGAGGLELSGTVFMDIELSTDGLTSVSQATIGIFGRSFNTTSPGSFAWQTFSGTGAAPSGLVANSAPYQWYTADATAALPAGDDGILLRITPGPPSNSLVVNSVEICFDAQ
jgi:hypothetical protein